MLHRIAKAAELLDCSENHVRNLIAAGKLRCVNIGTKSRQSVRISQSSLDQFLDGCEIHPPVKTRRPKPRNIKRHYR